MAIFSHHLPAATQFEMSGTTGSASVDIVVQDAVKQAFAVPLAWFFPDDLPMQTDNAVVKIFNPQLDTSTFPGNMLLGFVVSCNIGGLQRSWEFKVLADMGNLGRSILEAVGEMLCNEFHTLSDHVPESAIVWTGYPMLSCTISAGYADSSRRLGLVDQAGKLHGIAELVEVIGPEADGASGTIHAELALLYSDLPPIVGVPVLSMPAKPDVFATVFASASHAGIAARLMFPTSQSGLHASASLYVAGALPLSMAMLGATAGLASEFPLSLLDMDVPVLRNSAVVLVAEIGLGMMFNSAISAACGAVIEASFVHRWAPDMGLGIGCTYGYWMPWPTSSVVAGEIPSGLAGQLSLVFSL